MKFNKLARGLDLSVSELAEIVKDVLPGANGGTEVDDTQVEEIKALVTSGKTSPQSTASTGTSGANEVFETDAPSDDDLGIAVLGGMLQEYEHRIRGLTVAHKWINSHEEVGDYPANPVAAKLTETVCLLRSLNIPYQAPQPAIKSSDNAEGSGVTLPPLVRNLLATAYPVELASLDRSLPEQSSLQTSHPQLSAAQ